MSWLLVVSLLLLCVFLYSPFSFSFVFDCVVLNGFDSLSCLLLLLFCLSTQGFLRTGLLEPMGPKGPMGPHEPHGPHRPHGAHGPKNRCSQESISI